MGMGRRTPLPLPQPLDQRIITGGWPGTGHGQAGRFHPVTLAWPMTPGQRSILCGRVRFQAEALISSANSEHQKALTTQLQDYLSDWRRQTPVRPWHAVLVPSFQFC